MEIKIRRLLFLLICVTPLCGFSQVVLEQSIDTIQIKIGEQTTLRFSVYVNDGQKVVFPDFTKKGNIVSNIEVLDSSIDTLKEDDDKLKITKSYLLTSFESKLYSIPSLTIYVDGKPFCTNIFALKVLDVAIDTTHLDKFYPPKGVQDTPFNIGEWMPLLIYSVLFTVSLILLLYVASRRRYGKPILSKMVLVRFIPAHQKALESINGLKSKQWDMLDNPKEYYTQLTDILRKYIKQRFGFDAMEMTSSEIIERLKKENLRDVEEVRNLFSTADLVKFAKHSTQVNENDMNLLTALQFIDVTKSDEKPHIEMVRKSTSQSDKSRNKWILKTILIVSLLILSIVSLVLWGYSLYTLI